MPCLVRKTLKNEHRRCKEIRDMYNCGGVENPVRISRFEPAGAGADSMIMSGLLLESALEKAPERQFLAEADDSNSPYSPSQSLI